jgi:hypothetical protein
MIFTPSAVADILIFCILGLILFHTLALIRKGHWLLLDPLNIFWAGIVVVYIIQPSSYASTLIGWHQDGVFEESLFWTLFGLIFVVLGYERPIGRIRTNLIPNCPKRFSPNRLYLASCFLLILGMVGYLYLFSSAGGFDRWIELGRGGTDYEKISGYIAGLADFLPMGILTMLLHVEIHGVTRSKRLAVWLLGWLMLLWFVYLGTRSRTISFSILLLAVYYLPKKMNPPLWLAVSIFLGLSVLANFQAIYRDKFTNLSINLGQINMEEAYKLSAPWFLGGNSEKQSEGVSRGMEFNCVMTVVDLVPTKVGFNYGYGHLEAFTRIIPRVFWPEKIYPGLESTQGVLREGGLSDASVRNTNLLMGPALTFVGHWYYVGGAVGLALGGLLTGLLLRLIRHVYERAFPSEGDVLLYMLLISIGFVEAAATPLSWIVSMPTSILPVILVMYLARFRSTEGTSNAGDIETECSRLRRGGYEKRDSFV